MKASPTSYNSACGEEHSNSTCSIQRNLRCIDGICQCIDGFYYDDGSCQTKSVKFFFITCGLILIVCLTTGFFYIAYVMFKKESENQSMSGNSEYLPPVLPRSDHPLASYVTSFHSISINSIERPSNRDYPPPYSEELPPSYLEAMASSNI